MRGVARLLSPPRTNFQFRSAVVGAQGGTPLHFAVHQNKPAAVEQLLEKGANVNATQAVRNKSPLAPMHIVRLRRPFPPPYAPLSTDTQPMSHCAAPAGLAAAARAVAERRVTEGILTSHAATHVHALLVPMAATAERQDPSPPCCTRRLARPH
jgi:hypothetical protein